MAGVLQVAVGEQQVGARHADVVFSQEPDQRVEPVGGDHLDVVVQQAQHLAVGVSGAQVGLLGKVEGRIEGDEDQTVAEDA